MLGLRSRSGGLLVAAAVGAAALDAPPAAAQVPILRRGAPPRIEGATKRPVLAPSERMARDFTRAKQSGAFLGVMLHSVDRVLSGAADKTEFDLAVEQALARHPGVSRETLAKMVADYKAVPVDVRARAMPLEVATLSPSAGLTLAQARQLSVAPAGARGIIVQGGLRGPLSRVLATPAARGEGSAAPRLDAVGALVENSTRRVVLEGSFAGSSPVVPIYLKPRQGQSLDEAGFQVIGGERVAVVLGRVADHRGRVEGALPVGLAPGEYEVTVRVPRGPGNEPVTNARTLQLDAFAYTLRLLSIRCLDESDPETVLAGPNLTDEVVVGWAAFADAGPAIVSYTSDYTGFDDNVERTVVAHPRDEGGVFMAASAEASPGIVANRLFAIVQLWEWDGSGSAISKDPVQAFMADVGRASLDELDVQQFLERLSQAMHFAVAFRSGSQESLGEARLSFSAGELQSMTNNEAGRHRGELRFANDDATGTYSVQYEIRRHAAPR